MPDERLVDTRGLDVDQVGQRVQYLILSADRAVTESDPGLYDSVVAEYEQLFREYPDAVNEFLQKQAS